MGINDAPSPDRALGNSRKCGTAVGKSQSSCCGFGRELSAIIDLDNSSDPSTISETLTNGER